MNKILLLLFVIAATFAPHAGAQSSGHAKKAILMVHFGTTFDDTRAATIDAVNAKAAEEFPEYKVVEAYTSRIVINRLKRRGIEKPTPQQALLRLAAEGYATVIVQGTNIIDGIETAVLRKEALEMAPFFEEINVGRPLLYSIEDGERVVEILSGRYGERKPKDSAVVFVGHGTSTPANAMYSQIDYMFGASGHNSFHVATVEGYPTYATVFDKLKAEKTKSVMLVPFMFVAGDHAKNDIDGEWREQLEREGFKVEAVMEGLGQVPEIQEMYIDHIRDAIANPMQDASQQKALFIKENL